MCIYSFLPTKDHLVDINTKEGLNKYFLVDGFLYKYTQLKFAVGSQDGWRKKQRECLICF